MASREASSSSASDLEFQNLSKAYGSTVALQDLSFEVRPGEVFGFVGSNGAGKTTAMRIALGVLEPDGGQVCWGGAPITFQTRRRIGYMPEERGLYPKMRVGEQLGYLARLHGLSEADARTAVQRWTERLGVADRLGDEVQKLSLGNQQRVQLAAALVHDPAALVLDEPFSGLDPIAVDVMSAVLRDQAASGVPVLFSSHQLDLVERLCDRVGVVQAGRMVAVGAVDELRGAGPRQVVVVRTGPPTDWVAQVPGCRVVSQDGEATVVELAEGADDQDLLRAALVGAAVHEFRPRRPSLVELYRHVVSTAPHEPGRPGDRQPTTAGSNPKANKP